jgi:hypothetical protein
LILQNAETTCSKDRDMDQAAAVKDYSSGRGLLPLTRKSTARLPHCEQTSRAARRANGDVAGIGRQHDRSTSTMRRVTRDA